MEVKYAFWSQNGYSWDDDGWDWANTTRTKPGWQQVCTTGLSKKKPQTFMKSVVFQFACDFSPR